MTPLSSSLITLLGVISLLLLLLVRRSRINIADQPDCLAGQPFGPLLLGEAQPLSESEVHDDPGMEDRDSQNYELSSSYS